MSAADAFSPFYLQEEKGIQAVCIGEQESSDTAHCGEVGTYEKERSTEKAGQIKIRYVALFLTVHQIPLSS